MKYFQGCVGLLSLILVGCSDSTYAPVVEVGQMAPIPSSGVHRVTAGETLYEIAWRYGLDYRALAVRNDIPSPYNIQPGQRIYLTTAIMPTARAYLVKESADNHAWSKEAIKARPPVTVKDGAKEMAIVSSWSWPIHGKVIKPYSSTNKGLDIQGKLGAPVYPTAPGRVVYSGNGLRGYGNLIILKHNNLYLSAYAYNAHVFVKEGDWVESGQKMSEVGVNDQNIPSIHFEIRRTGRPVNPVTLLKSSG